MTLIHPAAVQKRILGNGLRVLVKRDASAPVVAIVTYVNAGYFDETDDIVGIAHVLEHMYFKGTPTRGVGEIARQTKAVGGYLNAATIYDHTLYYVVAPSSGFVDALDVQADAYRNSLIDGGELARELEVIIQEAKRKADNPAAVAIETLHEELYDRHRIRRWRIGREDGLRRLTRDHLIAFYRNFYRPANTVLAIVGDVDPNVAFAEVERRYGSLTAGDPERSPGPSEANGRPGFRYRELAGDIAQTQFVFGWRTPGTLHPDTAPLDMLATVIGTGRASRLYRATRERKLVSSVTAYNYTPRDIGVFAIHAEAPPDKALAAVEAVWDQMRRVRDDGIGELELERARRITESRWIRRLEDMEGQANHVAEWESLGSWELGERYYERLMTIGAQELREKARQYLREDQTSLLTYRPDSQAPYAADAPGIRARLSASRAQPLDEPGRPERARVTAAARTPSLERVEAGVHVFRLPSGVPVLVRRKATPIVHAGVFALGGPSAETIEIGGRTLLMARTAIKGTARRSAVQIAEDGEMLGGSIGASVGGDSVGWAISVPTVHAAAAIELLADVAQHPVFDPAALETERAVALADLASLHDDMYRFPMRLATQAAYAGHPYGVPALGTETSLRAHTRDDLAGWHRSLMLEAASVVAIVGDAEPAELAAVAAQHFSELRFAAPAPLPPPQWPARMVESVERREKAQTALVLSWPGPSRADIARFDVAMIVGVASGLGGRLFEELRDKESLCYTVMAFGGERRVAGTFNAYIATSPEKEDAARAGLLRELAKFTEAAVSDAELQRAKTYAIGSHAIRRQSGGAVLAELVDAWLFGELADLEEYENRVRAVTAGGIRDTARRYIDPARRVEGIVRGAGRTV